MAVYRFKVSFEDYDEVSRIIDIKSSQTFIDFHQIIHKSTGYDTEKSSSFYISTDHWIKGDEIAYLPTQRKTDRGVALMEKAVLKDFIDDPHQKFYYTYNFDRPYDFHVELIQIILNEDDKINYPAIFKSTGEAPKIISQIVAGESLASTTPTSNDDFDFLNEMDIVPADAEEIEALSDMGVNQEEESEEEEENDEFSDEFSDNENYEDEDSY